MYGCMKGFWIPCDDCKEWEMPVCNECIRTDKFTRAAAIVAATAISGTPPQMLVAVAAAMLAVSDKSFSGQFNYKSGNSPVETLLEDTYWLLGAYISIRYLALR